MVTEKLPQRCMTEISIATPEHTQKYQQLNLNISLMVMKDIWTGTMTAASTATEDDAHWTDMSVSTTHWLRQNIPLSHK